MSWLINIWKEIKLELNYRKKMRIAKKKDPHIYK